MKSSNEYGDSSSSGGKSDSTMGKLMEKAGGMMNNEKLAEKGREKREGAGYGGADSYGSGGDSYGSGGDSYGDSRRDNY